MLCRRVPSVESINPGVATWAYKGFLKHLCVELLIPKGTVTQTAYLHLYFPSAFKNHKTLSAGRTFFLMF